MMQPVPGHRPPAYARRRGQELAEYAIVTAFAVIGLVGLLTAFEDVITKLYRTSASLVTSSFP